MNRTEIFSPDGPKFSIFKSLSGGNHEHGKTGSDRGDPA